jgi:hypothetical protein
LHTAKRTTGLLNTGGKVKVFRFRSSSIEYRRTRRRPPRVASGEAPSATAATAASSAWMKELRARGRSPSSEGPDNGTKASWLEESVGLVSVPGRRLVKKPTTGEGGHWWWRRKYGLIMRRRQLLQVAAQRKRVATSLMRRRISPTTSSEGVVDDSSITMDRSI